MAREIPEVVRAAAGLAATVLDEARKLPETLPGLPVRVIGLAMQSALKVQQQYAGLVARGDELFTGLRGEDEPGLATFDDDLDEPTPRRVERLPGVGLRPGRAGRLADDRRRRRGRPPATAEPTPSPRASTSSPKADEPRGRRGARRAGARTPQVALDEIAGRGAERPRRSSRSWPSTRWSRDDGDRRRARPPPTSLTAGRRVATVEAAVTDEGVAAPEAAAAHRPRRPHRRGAARRSPPAGRLDRHRRRTGPARRRSDHRPRSTATTTSPSPSSAAGSAATR